MVYDPILIGMFGSLTMGMADVVCNTSKCALEGVRHAARIGELCLCFRFLYVGCQDS